MINLSSHKAFSIYLLFAALFLGVQMFQGLSYLDIGMYMSGYQHFTSDPYASYFLGQWILTYDVTSALCKLFSINSFLGLRVLHLVYVLVTQTVVYLYLRQYISTNNCREKTRKVQNLLQGLSKITKINISSQQRWKMQ